MDWKTFIVLMSIIVGWVGLGCYRSWCQTQETIASIVGHLPRGRVGPDGQTRVFNIKREYEPTFSATRVEDW